jgi:hypothetical protein
MPAEGDPITIPPFNEQAAEGTPAGQRLRYALFRSALIVAILFPPVYRGLITVPLIVGGKPIAAQEPIPPKASTAVSLHFAYAIGSSSTSALTVEELMAVTSPVVAEIPNVDAAPRFGPAIQAPVAGTTVNVHTLSLSIVFGESARSLTPEAPLLIMAVYVPTELNGCSGVNVAMSPVASRATDPSTEGLAGAGPVTIKFVPAMTVVGSICKPEGTTKVALTLELGHTAGALGTGNTEPTVIFPAGAAAAVVNVHT